MENNFKMEIKEREPWMSNSTILNRPSRENIKMKMKSANKKFILYSLRM